MILHRDEARPPVSLRQAERLHHLPRITRARADIADLPLANEIVECPECLLDRGVRIEPVDLVEIDRVDAKPAQARLARLHDMLAREPAHCLTFAHRPVRLGGDDNFVEVRHRAQRSSGHLLAHAEGVHVGGVEEVDAAIERLTEERARGVLVEDPGSPFGAPVAHAPEADP